MITNSLTRLGAGALLVGALLAPTATGAEAASNLSYLDEGRATCIIGDDYLRVEAFGRPDFHGQYMSVQFFWRENRSGDHYAGWKKWTTPRPVPLLNGVNTFLAGEQWHVHPGDYTAYVLVARWTGRHWEYGEWELADHGTATGNHDEHVWNEGDFSHHAAYRNCIL